MSINLIYLCVVLLTAFLNGTCDLGASDGIQINQQMESSVIDKVIDLTNIVDQFHKSRDSSLGQHLHSQKESDFVLVGSEGDSLKQEIAPLKDEDLAKYRILFSPNGITSLPTTKVGFNSTCNNKICLVYESALSCKVIGVGLRKICAQYLLGYIFGCSIFPPASQIFNAPYVCAEELQTKLTPLLTSVKGGGGAISTKGDNPITRYLGNINGNNCKRNCYQTYLKASEDFYGSCKSELNNVTYPVTTLLTNFSSFRGQACAEDPNLQPTAQNPNQEPNCFANLYKQSQTPNPLLGPINLFDYTCSYHQDPSIVPFILQGVCQKLLTWGCCPANQMATVALNQINATNIQTFPPCLMRYIKRNSNCAGIDPTNFCTSGANANMTIIVKGNVTIAASSTLIVNDFFPNVYLNTQPVSGSLTTYSGILTLQGIIGQALNLPGGTKAALNVIITDYAYYNDTGMISTVSGLPLSPPDSDYNMAINAGRVRKTGKLVVEFMVIMPGISDSQAAVYAKDAQSKILAAMRNQNGFDLFGADSTVTIASGPQMFTADPFITTKNAASPSFYISNNSLLTLAATMIAAMMSLLYV